MMQINFYNWLLFVESSQEDEAKAILQNDDELLKKAKSIVPQPKFLPAAAIFIKEDPHIDLELLKDDFVKYAEFVAKNLVNMVTVKKFPTGGTANYKLFIKNKDGTETELNSTRFSEIVHAIESNKALEGIKSKKIDTSDFGDAVFSNDKVTVYESNSPDRCIRFGIGQSFCISAPGRSYFHGYRFGNRVSTFYFVFDKTRDANDPLSIVVVDIDKNGKPLLTDKTNSTGSIAQFNKHNNNTDEGKLANAMDYMEYLKNNLGADLSVFKHIALSPTEKTTHEKLSRANNTLKWFKELNPNEKLQYISYGHILTDDQFNYVMNYMPNLLKAYVDIGHRIPVSQQNKIFKNNELRKTYLRKRLIRATGDAKSSMIDYNEYLHLRPEQAEQLTARNIEFIQMDGINHENGSIEKIIQSKNPQEALIDILKMSNGIFKQNRGTSYSESEKFNEENKLFETVINKIKNSKIAELFNKELINLPDDQKARNIVNYFNLRDGYLLLNLPKLDAIATITKCNEETLKKILLSSLGLPNNIESDEDIFQAIYGDLNWTVNSSSTKSFFLFYDFFKKWFGTEFVKKMFAYRNKPKNAFKDEPEESISEKLIEPLWNISGIYDLNIVTPDIVKFLTNNPEYQQEFQQVINSAKLYTDKDTNWNISSTLKKLNMDEIEYAANLKLISHDAVIKILSYDKELIKKLGAINVLDYLNKHTKNIKEDLRMHALFSVLSDEIHNLQSLHDVTKKIVNFLTPEKRSGDNAYLISSFAEFVAKANKFPMVQVYNTIKKAVGDSFDLPNLDRYIASSISYFLSNEWEPENETKRQFITNFIKDLKTINPEISSLSILYQIALNSDNLNDIYEKYKKLTKEYRIDTLLPENNSWYNYYDAYTILQRLFYDYLTSDTDKAKVIEILEYIKSKMHDNFEKVLSERLNKETTKSSKDEKEKQTDINIRRDIAKRFGIEYKTEVSK